MVWRYAWSRTLKNIINSQAAEGCFTSKPIHGFLEKGKEGPVANCQAHAMQCFLNVNPTSGELSPESRARGLEKNYPPLPKGIYVLLRSTSQRQYPSCSCSEDPCYYQPRTRECQLIDRGPIALQVPH